MGLVCAVGCFAAADSGEKGGAVEISADWVLVWLVVFFPAWLPARALVSGEGDVSLLDDDVVCDFWGLH